jgi:hypothetical protein
MGALTPHLRGLVRSRRVPVGDLRAAAAQATGTEDEQLVPIHRFRVRDLFVTGAIAAAAYLLITKLAEIGLTPSPMSCAGRRSRGSSPACSWPS